MTRPTEVAVVVAGSALGLVMLVPAFRRLTPAGTLLLVFGVPAAVMLRGILTFGFFAGDAYIPLLLQTWRDTPATLTGIVFTATTVAWSAGTWLQARRIDRTGPRWFGGLGFAFLVVGIALTIPVVVPGVPPELSIVTWSVAGIGMGFAYSALTLVVLRHSDAAEQGAASSALQLSDILGTALGAGIGGAITAAGERAGGNGLGWALAVVFTVALAVSLAGLVGSRRLPGRPPRQEPAVRNQGHAARKQAPAAVD
jgi:MFS family permease